MAKTCQLTGRRMHTGNHVSHAKNRRKRTFRPNLQRKRFFVPSLGGTVVLVLSAKAIKTVTKLGIEVVVREILARGERIRVHPRPVELPSTG